MRISDWSSDVCSSDLEILIFNVKQYILWLLNYRRYRTPLMHWNLISIKKPWKSITAATTRAIWITSIKRLQAPMRKICPSKPSAKTSKNQAPLYETQVGAITTTPCSERDRRKDD